MTDPTIIDASRGERDVLAHAIVNTAKRLGITRAEQPLTGPEVMLLLQEIEFAALAPNDHQLVGDFHEKFGLPNTTHHPPAPHEVSDDLLTFRVRFMTEELCEFVEDTTDISPEVKAAFETIRRAKFAFRVDPDVPKAFDALLDLDYVVHGTAHVFGFPWYVGMMEVQRANMSKERALKAEDSARGSVWDVIKPKGWTAPDIAGILRRFGWNV